MQTHKRPPKLNNQTLHRQVTEDAEDDAEILQRSQPSETIKCETGLPVPYGPHYPQEYLDLGNQLRTTTLPGKFEAPQKSCAIYITNYQTKGPHIVIRISVAITLNFEAKVGVYQNLLPLDHELWRGLPTKYDTVSAITVLLKNLSSLEVCEGNGDNQFLDHFSFTTRNQPNHSHRAESAYRDTNVMYDTIRTVRCQWLLNYGSRCNKCSGYRGTLRKGASTTTAAVVVTPNSLEEHPTAVQESLPLLPTEGSTYHSGQSPGDTTHHSGVLSLGGSTRHSVDLSLSKEDTGSEDTSSHGSGPFNDVDSLAGKWNDSPSTTHITAAALEIAPNSLEEQAVAVGEPFSVLSPEGSTHHSGQSPGGSTHHSGVLSTGGTTHHPGVLSPGGTTHHPGVLSPGGTTHHPGVLSPGGTTHHSGVLSPGGTTHHPGVQSPGGTTHHSGVLSPDFTKEPTSEKSLVCEICGKKFRMPESLSSHNYRKHKQRKIRKCDVCDKEFLSLWALNEHTRMHTGEKPHLCAVCGLGFRTLDHFYKHRRTHTHTGEKPHLCAVCGKEFRTLATLNQHRRIHTGEKPYKCDDCGEAFGYFASYKKHQLKHTGETPFVCSICGKKLSSKLSLTMHERIHTGERPHQCVICGKGFIIAGSLKQHMNLHTGKRPYQCNVCGKGCWFPSDLKVHSLKHTGERPFQCDVCGKGFTTALTLKDHKRLHTGERPYKCTVCGKAYASLSSLSTHKQIKHTQIEDL